MTTTRVVKAKTMLESLGLSKTRTDGGGNMLGKEVGRLVDSQVRR